MLNLMEVKYLCLEHIFFSLASKTTGLGLGLEESWPWPVRPLGRPWPRILLALASKNTGLGLGLEPIPEFVSLIQLLLPNQINHYYHYLMMRYIMECYFCMKTAQGAIKRDVNQSHKYD